MSATRIILSFFLLEFWEVLSEREHKVHNIVLYPEKHSWCQITPIQQIIASPGYESATIDNNVCVGACFSYSIPKTQPAEPGELIGPYCDSCQPSGIECYHVNLKKDANSPEGPKILQKRVQIITNCSCQNCDKIRSGDCEITDGSTLELPFNLFTHERNSSRPGSDELPDILETKSSQSHHQDTEDDVRKEKHKKWLKSHSDEMEGLYRLFLEQNRENNAEIGNDEDDADSQEDLEKKLESVEHPNEIRLLDRILFLERNQENNAKIQKDLKNVPDSFGVEGAPSGLRGNHIALGLKPNPSVSVKDLEKLSDNVEHPNDILVSVGKKNHDGDTDEVAGVRTHHSHHHNHHLGEVEYVGMNVVHLVKGPHGSMVAAPVGAKLEIDSDALKPNSEGVVIDYENPHAKTAASRIADLFN